MIPTGRALALLGLVTLLFVFAFVAPALAAVAAVADLVVLALVWADARAASRVAMTLRRRLPERAFQGEPVSVAWEVENRGARALLVRVRDALDPCLADAAVEFTLRVPPRATETHAVTLVPRRRGTASPAPVAVRVLGPSGLAWAPRDVGGEAPFPVHPRLHPDGDDAVALRRVLAARPGRHVLSRGGISTDFHALREYRRGDDYRRIHWKATARRGRPVTVETSWEQEQELVVMVDCGRPMAALSGPWCKLDHALAAALALARAAAAWEDTVTVVLFSDAIRRVVRVDGRAGGFARMLDALAAEPVDESETDHALAAGWCMRQVPRRSLVFLFTSVGDALAADAVAEATLALARRHRPVLVDLEDPGTAAAARSLPADVTGAYAKVSALAVEEANEGLYARLRQRKVDVVPTPADRLTVRVLDAWLRARGQGV